MSKKDRILAAAINEFAENDFAKASTNTIIEKADASKGLLFHYFGNKKKLFLLCATIMLDELTTYLCDTINESDRDIFEICLFLHEKKMIWFSENPKYALLLNNFINAAVMDETRELQELEYFYTDKVFNKAVEHCDKSLFRKDIDTNEILKYIMAVLEHNSREMLLNSSRELEEKLKNIDKLMVKMKTTMELMKYGVYNRR